jgi:hypothetical protein
MQVGSQTAEEMYSLIRQAILEKAIVAVSYRGSIREMCPHVLGKKKGPLYALLYQFAGESATGLKFDGSPGNWRCLCIDEISHVALRKAGGEWHTASNYSSMQNCVDEIDVKVETRAA